MLPLFLPGMYQNLCSYLVMLGRNIFLPKVVSSICLNQDVLQFFCLAFKHPKEGALYSLPVATTTFRFS